MNWEKLKANEAEKGILGYIFSRKDSIYEIAEKVTAAMFYSQQHKLIYESMLELMQAKIPIDLVTMVEHLKDKDELEKVGNVTAITFLANNAPDGESVRAYIGILKDCYVRRETALIGEEMAMAAQNGKVDILAYQKRLSAVSAGTDELPNMREDVLAFAEWMQDRAQQNVTGIMSGIAPVDVLTKGWQKKNLIVLAGRPGMGKTAMAGLLAVNSARKGNHTAFFSLEMSKEELLARIVTMRTGIPCDTVMNPKGMSEENWGKVLSALDWIGKLPLHIFDSAGMTPVAISSLSRQLHGKYGLGLVIVDYLQIVKSGWEGNVNRVQEVGYISASLKDMAKSLDVPVIALSQLSRGVESRNNKRPMLSDLRDSGSIEQDADMIIMLYRDKYYNPNVQDDITEFDVKKFRMGRPKCINLRFIPERMIFESAANFDGRAVRERDIPMM